MRLTRAVFLLGCLLLWSYDAVAGLAMQNPATLTADQFDYDNNTQTFTATGNVVLIQDEQSVRADRVTYNRPRDEVLAEGNVVFTDKMGQTYQARRVRLSNKLKRGAVEQIMVNFPDGSRFSAAHGEQMDENNIVLRDASYTACKICDGKDPLWQLHAGKIRHNKIKKNIYYTNARMEVRGKPVLYTPRFSHPDPTVRARSGLLSPRIATDSKNGFMVRNYYYHNFSPQTDATIEFSSSQNSNELFGTDLRHHFDNGIIQFQGSVNRSAIRAGDDNNVIEPEQTRGHFVLTGNFDLDREWSTGFDLRRTLDDFYLRDFDFDTNAILRNRAYVQRLNGRDITDISAHYFQDLRPDIDQEQPNIMPFVQHDLTGDPNAMFGGRWAVENDLITLFRDGQQSVSRLSVHPSWERRDILPFGVKTMWQNKLRADNYWVRQGSPFDTAPSDPNVDRTVSRLTPSTQVLTSLPFVRPVNNMTALVEPKAALTVMPNTRIDGDIPNEDSRDVQIDISNLFMDSRFPGADRIETGTHASYGLKVGGYDNSGNSTFFTLGQSFRMTNSNPFPDGSGLEDQRSDIVGQFEVTAYDRLYLDYRFQFNEQDFSDRRHELQGLLRDDQTELRTSYIFAEQVQGTGLADDRQQLGFEVARSLNRTWSAAINSVHDMSGEGGLLKSGGTIQYKNECLRLALRGERDLTNRQLGGSDQRIIFSVGLRNLGGYDTPILSDDPLYKPYERDRR